jgi:Flp pilus assembly pilin Flp
MTVRAGKLGRRGVDQHLPRSLPMVPRDERGAVFAEYAIVMVTVTLIAAFAIAALAVPLFNLYSFAESLIGLPVP